MVEGVPQRGVPAAQLDQLLAVSVADLESFEECALRIDEVVRDFSVNENPVNRAASLAVMLVGVTPDHARDNSTGV